MWLQLIKILSLFCPLVASNSNNSCIMRQMSVLLKTFLVNELNFTCYLVVIAASAFADEFYI
jgi:hypothetical protein